MSERMLCAHCGGWFDRPGIYGCNDDRHATPSLAQKIAAAIEHDLDERCDMMDSTDETEDAQQEIRDEWARIIQVILDEEQAR